MTSATNAAAAARARSRVRARSGNTTFESAWNKLTQFAKKLSEGTHYDQTLIKTKGPRKTFAIELIAVGVHPDKINKIFNEKGIRFSKKLHDGQVNARWTFASTPPYQHTHERKLL